MNAEGLAHLGPAVTLAIKKGGAKSLERIGELYRKLEGD